MPSVWRKAAGAVLALVVAVVIMVSSPTAQAQRYMGQRTVAAKPYNVAQMRYYRIYQPRYRYVRHQRFRGYGLKPRSRYSKRRSKRGKHRKSVKPILSAAKKNKGPVQLVVSLKRQRVTVYQNGKPVTSSRISSGRDGHNTPSGVFSIIQKNRRHYSNIYHGAPMPYMQRITWSGIALHGGHVPGYRASHGCIRLPHRFARSLFNYTKMGAHVVIANGDPTPRPFSHAKLFQPTSPFKVPTKKKPSTPTALIHFDPAEGMVRDVVRLASLQKADPATQVDAAPQTAFVPPTPSEVLPVNAATAATMLAIIEGKVQRAEFYKARSKSPIRILITRRTGREKMRDAQRLLARLGYDPGIPDGVVGRQTVKAIKAFQAAREIPQSGTPNAQFYAELYRASGLEQPNEGHLYVRQNFRSVYDAPIVLKDPSKPVGTHFYMVMNFKSGDTTANWRAMTLKARGRLPRSWRKRQKRAKRKTTPATITAAQALDRFEIPKHVRARISDMLTPGSSLIISDKGISHETGRGTDFVVLTR